MKRLLVLVAVAAAVAALASVAVAGDYHVGQLLVCSDCHVMHGSQSHPYLETGEFVVPGSKSASSPPYKYLLRQESINTACLACHDGRTDVPDVLGASAAAPTNGRLAGALNATAGHGFTNSDGYQTGDGHTLWSSEPPPGSNGVFVASRDDWATEGLECSDCHSVHGAANYRNMRTTTRSTTSMWYRVNVTYEIGGTPTNTKDVFERAPKGYGLNNVDYQEPAQDASKYGEWCQKCHTEYHGTETSPNMLTAAGDVGRHPTAGVDVTSSQYFNALRTIGGQSHRVKLMDGTGTWNLSNTTTMSPSCFSCHKSHGNKNSFGLIWFADVTTTGPNPAPTPGPISEEGDGSASSRDLCRQCHGPGSFPSGNPTNIIP
jgi:hypothetical protein